MSDTRAEFTIINRRSFARYLAVLGTGVAVGAAANGNLRISPSALAQSTETVDPTATREAELAELHALQTQVANPEVCSTATPGQPTATATQVPPSGAGIPLSYAGIWTITVLGIVPIPGTNASHPQGQFMQVTMTMAHTTDSSQLVPYADFQLEDGAGRLSYVNQTINRTLLGNDWLLGVPPGTSQDRSLIFDVAVNATEPFLLESKSDPTFRVQMKIEQRG
jgi:hypothetical protein